LGISPKILSGAADLCRSLRYYISILLKCQLSNTQNQPIFLKRFGSAFNSAKEGLILSFSLSKISLTLSKGHCTFISGSFHIRPPSSSG